MYHPADNCSNDHSLKKSRLCSTCNQIFLSFGFFRIAAKHYENIEALKAAVRTGCYICTSIWDQIQDSLDDSGYEVQYNIFDNGGSVLSLTFMLCARVDAFGSTRQAKSVVFYMIPKTAPGLAIDNILSSGTRSRESIAQAKKWIYACFDHHTACKPEQEYYELPTRLVEVTPQGGSTFSARLCESEGLDAHTAYLTLSHCWGMTKMVTLSKSNFARFQNEIPLSEVSPVFKHAVAFTGFLGFGFIWIDSLCIIQDDSADWERESELMGAIYKNSSCNLSASAFADGIDGMLVEQRRPNPTPAEVCIHVDENDLQERDAGKYPEGVLGNFYYVVMGQPWREIWNGPLFQRAWVLQEQLLAPRALHFGRDQLYFECKESFFNEVWPIGWRSPLLKDLWSDYSNALSRHPFWQFSKVHPSFTEYSPSDLWKRIVENFSQRKLSFSSNRLPALQGIASELEEHFPGYYRFGLWTDDLVRGLLWRQPRRLSDGSDGQAHNALAKDSSDIPSWSWASQDQSVSWSKECADARPDPDRRIWTRSCPIAKCLVYKDPDVHLEIIYSEGFLIDFQKEVLKSDFYVKQQTNDGLARAQLCFQPFPVNESDTHCYNIVLDFDHRIFRLNVKECIDVKDLIDTLVLPIYFLPLMMWENQMADKKAFGLLLLRVEHRRGTYNRIGTAVMSSSVNTAASIVQALAAYQRSIPEDDYIEFDSTAGYRVGLV